MAFCEHSKLERNYNSLVYKLQMIPNLPGRDLPARLSPWSVTTSALTSVDWTITPNGAATNPNVANLYYYSSSKGSATWVFVGQYYNTFLIHLTNP
jgi:hypothetical protein